MLNKVYNAFEIDFRSCFHLAYEKLSCTGARSMHRDPTHATSCRTTGVQQLDTAAIRKSSLRRCAAVQQLELGVSGRLARNLLDLSAVMQ